MNKLWLCTLLGWVCTLSVPGCGSTHATCARDASPASTLAPATARELDDRLRSFVEARAIPGLAIAVGRHDQLVWSAAFGVADLVSCEPVDGESIFPLGSTSKPLTALLLGQLIDEGRLELDAPIQNYVPYFPRKEKPLTARLLAGHLAGLRDYDRAKGEYDNTRYFASVREAVEVFADDPLLYEPGTRHAYSAYSFVLLSAAIEAASGADFLNALDGRLVQPLGLQHTGPNRATLPKLVSSYTRGFRNRIVPARVGDPSNKWAAGGLVSTPIEMVQIGNAVLAGRVVLPETFELLTTPQALADGSDSGAGYGMGWRRGTHQLANGRAVPIVHHGGTGPGSMSFFVIYPTEDLVVSMQCNLLFQPFTDFSSELLAVAERILRENK